MPLMTMLTTLVLHFSGSSKPINIVAPAVTGTAEAGQVLTCSTGSWVGTTPITYAYQWYRNSVLISGQTTNTYTVLSSDIGSVLSCTVTATNSVGSTNASSNSVSINPVIPAGAIIMYNGTDPSLSGWTRYTAADGLYIKGTATQGEIATTTAAAASSWSISAFLSTTGAHTATTGYRFTSSVNAGGITVLPANPKGDHVHSLSLSASSNAVRPYSTGFVLLKATSNQNVFPTNTIHINDTNRGSSWSQKLATTDYRYIKGDASTPTDYANVEEAVAATTGSAGFHTHVNDAATQSSSSPAPNTFNPASSTGQNHSHFVSTSVGVSRLNGKIHKMWIAASADPAYSNTIVMFDGTLSSLPSYWKVCDGTSGTVNMTTYFLGYSNSSGTAHDISTALTAVLNPSTAFDNWTHQHATGINTGTSFNVRTTGHGSASYSHTHTVSGTASVTGYDPGSIKLAFIQFIP